MAEKSTKKKAKTNSAVTWDLVIKCPGVITREGVVSANVGNSIILNTKRDGSSLRQKVTIPKNKIVFVEGSLTHGEESKIVYMSELAPFGRKMRRVEVDEIADKETGMLKGKNEKGTSLLINPEYADLITSKESTVDAPAGVAVKKKKKS